jgi:hypothetical protein
VMTRDNISEPKQPSRLLKNRNIGPPSVGCSVAGDG